jgi:hypothetical protein
MLFTDFETRNLLFAAVDSQTSGGRSVGIVGFQTTGMEFSFILVD